MIYVHTRFLRKKEFNQSRPDKHPLLKKRFLLGFSVIFSTLAYSQKTDRTISDADFKSYTDCQQYQNWKRNGKDSLVLYFSYDFDQQGNLVRKLKDQSFDTKELTVYSFNDLHQLLEETVYQKSYVKNWFNISKWTYFYNLNGQLDSLARVESYPVFDYLSLDKKNDADTIVPEMLRNILITGSGKSDTVELDEPILVPIDSCVYGRAFLTMKGKMIKGYTKVKKKAVPRTTQSYKALTFIYSYNSKGQKIKKFMDAEESEFAGPTTFIYDKKGRISEIFYSYQNLYKIRHGAIADSIYKWKSFFYRYMDSTKATIKTHEEITKKKADTLVHYNAYFNYHEDGSVTETAVFPNVMYKLTVYRNKKGQILKTINSRISAKNKYIKGKFMAADIKKNPVYNHDLHERTAFYLYDSLGRIIRRTTKYLDQEEGKPKQYENYIIFKYKDDYPLMLPEKEYADFIYEFNYHSE